MIFLDQENLDPQTPVFPARSSALQTASSQQQPATSKRFSYPMSTKEFFSAFLAAIFAVIYFPAEKASAQAQDGNFSSTPIEMVVNAGTNGERWQTSRFGIMEPVGLRPDEQIAITLIVSNTNRGYPVGLAPLDGGAILGAEDLIVAEDGTAGFTFQGGNTPGIYRVVATIGAQQYQLRLYVAHPQEIPGGCE